MKFGIMAKAGAGVLKGRIFGKISPLFVIWSATNRCNSKCAYCHIPQRNQRELTTDEVKHLIDEIKVLGARRFGIWGGEPLIRDDIGEIIDYAVNKNLYVTLDTNGYLVPAKINSLKNLSHLIISIDGDEAAHDANREPGSFKKALMGLEAASGQNMNLWTLTVLTKNNCNKKSIDFLLDLAEKLNFTTSYQLIHHGENFGDSITLKPTDAEKSIINYLIEMKKEGKRIGTSFAAFEHLLKWKDYSINKKFDKNCKKKCWGAKFFANVDTDGKIYPCSLLVDEIEADNFLDSGFASALKKVENLPCNQCLATCYSEYNLLFDLDLSTIMQWAKTLWRK